MLQTSSPAASISPDGRLEPPSRWGLLINAVTLSALWVMLSGYEDAMSWVIGLPTVIAATWSFRSLSHRGSGRVSVVGIIRLLPVFFWESFRGGFDVARRVLRRHPKVEPGLFDYRLNLISTSARVFFVDLVSLLPGTLSADIRGDRMQIHTLDVKHNSVSELKRLERQVAAVFGQTLPDEAVKMR